MRKNNVLLEVAHYASFFQRLKGLMGTQSLDQNQGILLYPCKSVHTCFMNYPIQAVFLDASKRIVGIEVKLEPWKKSKYYKEAYYCLEHNAFSQSFRVGEVLEFNEEEKDDPVRSKR